MNTKYFNSKTRLKDLQLYRKDSGFYCLKAVYTSEDDNGNKVEITVPEIQLPFSNYPVFEVESNIYGETLLVGNFGTHGSQVVAPNNGEYYTVKYIKKKMTVAEIEKELGYSVEIVK